MSNTTIIDHIPIKFDRRSRSIKLKINALGKVSITAPWFTPKFLIKKFIRSQQTWILRHQSQALNRDHATTATQVKVFGQTYIKRIVTTQQAYTHRPGIFVKKKYIIYFPANPRQTYQLLQREFDLKLNNWLKRTCHIYISRRAETLAKQMKIDFRKITLKQLSSRWGSCSARGNLNFNWRLVHFVPAVIDYVIIHELAHRVHLNHSSNFWQLVSQFDPKYKYHRRQLTKLAV